MHNFDLQGFLQILKSVLFCKYSKMFLYSRIENFRVSLLQFAFVKWCTCDLLFSWFRWPVLGILSFFHLASYKTKVFIGAEKCTVLEVSGCAEGVEKCTVLEVSGCAEGAELYSCQSNEKLLFWATDVESTIDYTKMENLDDGIVDNSPSQGLLPHAVCHFLCYAVCRIVHCREPWGHLLHWYTMLLKFLFKPKRPINSSILPRLQLVQSLMMIAEDVVSWGWRYYFRWRSLRMSS